MEYYTIFILPALSMKAILKEKSLLPKSKLFHLRISQFWKWAEQTVKESAPFVNWWENMKVPLTP